MHIGEVARRAGLPVKTVRYYSDLGLVPEAARTAAGYRRYDSAAVVRLEYVRTLRELGLDLATIRRLLERQDELPRVAAAHADALTAQIRLLRIQRGALRALARRDPTPEEVEKMTRLAQATAEERRRLINEFVDSIFAGVPDNGLARGMRQAMPELPEEPTEDQVDAWIELAELVSDSDFRARLHAMSQESFGTGDKPPRESPIPPRPARPASIRPHRPPTPSMTSWSRRSPPRRAALPMRRTVGNCSPPWNWARNPAPSATGSWSPSSTAGRRSPR
jgi:DNA-binding transcriptional MerR regulator